MADRAVICNSQSQKGGVHNAQFAESYEPAYAKPGDKAHNERLNQWSGLDPLDKDAVVQKNLKNHAEIVDFGNIWDSNTKVIGFGETHSNLTTKDALALSMRQLHQLGATHLAMEMLPSKKQKLVDDYYAGKVSRQAIKQIFTNYWKWPNQEEGYMSVVDAAKQEGIKTIALNISGNEGRPSDHEIKDRETVWAKKIASIVEASPNNRIVLYTGAAHQQKNRETSGVSVQLEQEFGIKTTVVLMEGGCPKVNELTMLLAHNKNCGLVVSETETAAQAIGMEGKNFAIKLDDKRPKYVVHIKEEGPYWDLAKQYPESIWHKRVRQLSF